jgi:hypothetical protein
MRGSDVPFLHLRLRGRSGAARLGVLVLAAVATAVSLQVAFGSGNGIRPTDVTDLPTARAYLAQEVDAFLPERSSDVTGDFEYMVVSGKTVAEFQAARGIVDEWVQNPPAVAVVISWTSTAVTFQIPRPRPGHEVALAGDTLLLILTPERGIKTATVVPRSELTPFEAVAQDRVSESLVLSATK